MVIYKRVSVSTKRTNKRLNVVNFEKGYYLRFESRFSFIEVTQRNYTRKNLLKMSYE